MMRFQELRWLSAAQANDAKTCGSTFSFHEHADKGVAGLSATVGARHTQRQESATSQDGSVEHSNHNLL